ncbi:universal stress protein [Natrarchaeobius halalkaliphilus]|uniref:Universal stress protein n=1 Tax=Natrarchaeobius halalkaliphilus TaxID=1679091 RepID=A0A3N6P1M6_9EURY|nr:universal stress protein [Natrarchaeobius halalkaliphilus]RQG91419.1 universal stress protein [Natrarchaeobius halalkaliphilus]
MYHDVLIPTDGSDGTRRSIVHGLTIAERFDATVHALSVVPEGPLGTLESEEATPAAHRAVDHVAATAKRSGLEAVTAVDHGVPHEEILSYADEHGIDMIVMGTQGRTGLDRVLVGSVTERVVRMADVPIVTVRLTDDRRIETSEEAEAIARESLEESVTDSGDEAKTRDSYRISATWYVEFGTSSGPIQVQVDAVSGETRRSNVDE